MVLREVTCRVSWREKIFFFGGPHWNINIWCCFSFFIYMYLSNLFPLCIFKKKYNILIKTAPGNSLVLGSAKMQVALKHMQSVNVLYSYFRRFSFKTKLLNCFSCKIIRYYTGIQIYDSDVEFSNVNVFIKCCVLLLHVYPPP